MSLIAVSGVDGSGKSTQIALLARHLAESGDRVTVRWFRPGYSQRATALKRLLHIPSAAPPATDRSSDSHAANRDNAMRRPAIRLAWLVFAGLDTAIEYGLVARLYRRKGVAIYDRWAFDAILDLQLHFPDRPAAVALLQRLILTCAVEPDHALLIMVPAETSASRLAGKVDPFPDPPDRASLRNSIYADYASQHLDAVVDGVGAPADVHADIRARLTESASRSRISRTCSASQPTKGLC